LNIASRLSMNEVPDSSNIEKFLKYVASLTLFSGEDIFNSHMTRKKAISAVTKSAYATFHEPPW